MPAYDPKLEKQIKRLLEQPEFYPDELKKWVIATVQNNPSVFSGPTNAPSWQDVRYLGIMSPTDFGNSVVGREQDGDLVDILLPNGWAGAGSGLVWRFRFRKDSMSSFKWDFVGGPPLHDWVDTLGTTTSTTYVALASAGPACAIPRLGAYDVEIGCRAYMDADSISALMSYDIGATGAVDTDAIQYYSGASSIVGASTTGNFSRARRKSNLSAVTLTAKYRSTSAGITGKFDFRWMRVCPIAIS